MFVALHGLGDGTIDKGSRALVLTCRVLLKDISLRWSHSHFDLNIFFHIFFDAARATSAVGFDAYNALAFETYK